MTPRTLVHAARLDDREWRHLGELMAQAGCAADPAVLRAEHPEFDATRPSDPGDRGVR